VWNGPGSAAHHFAQGRYVLRSARDTPPWPFRR
jgi:hypothetical protein